MNLLMGEELSPLMQGASSLAESEFDVMCGWSLHHMRTAICAMHHSTPETCCDCKSHLAKATNFDGFQINDMTGAAAWKWSLRPMFQFHALREKHAMSFTLLKQPPTDTACVG